jgi:hypothetical protein
MKRNKKPQNESDAKRIKRVYKDKRDWVVCIVCGDYCPQTLNEKNELLFDSVHLTCRYEPEYLALAKKLRKQQAEKATTFLFDF